MIKANALPTLIGSFPGSDYQKAMDLIFKYTPEIPCWPQLPAFPHEGMLIQFSHGLPGFDPEKLVIDPTSPGFEEEMLAFYEEYMAVKEGGKPLSESLFVIKETEAKGLYLLKENFKSKENAFAVKGQITGPFTLATGLKTPEGKAAFYDPTLRDIIVKMVAMKAAYQAEFLKELGMPVIIFLDEPALSGFGSSAFVGVSREEILAALSEVALEIKEREGLVGVHVCANTEWDLLIEAGLDVLNFDAFDYLDRFLLFAEDLKNFIAEGKVIAWGIVPTLKPEVLANIEADELVGKLDSSIEELAQKAQLDYQEILRHSLITPSCGMGTLPENLVEKALSLLKETSATLRAKL